MTGRLALAFAGGCAGGAVRLAIGAIWPADAGVPWTVLLINAVGSLAIGVVAVLWGGDRRWWPLLGPGFLGGFTTFSAIAALNWTSEVGLVASVTVLVASLVLCPIAARIGVTFGERLRGSR